MKYTVTFYEVNAVCVFQEADSPDAAIEIVKQRMEEGLDYNTEIVSMDYSHTLDTFSVFESK